MQGVLIKGIGKLTAINPMEFDNMHLPLKNNSDNTWSEFSLDITEMTKREFQRSLRDKTYEFIIGCNGHAMYVEKINSDGDLLYCINSAGEHGDQFNKPRPRIPTEDLDDEGVFAIKLVQRDGIVYNTFVMINNLLFTQ